MSLAAIRNMKKLFKLLFAYLIWIIVFAAISVGVVFFVVPFSYDLTNVVTYTLVISILLFILFFIVGMIRGKLRILRIYNRRSLIYRSVYFLSVLSIFVIVSVLQMGVRAGYIQINGMHELTSKEKVKFIKDVYTNLNTIKSRDELTKSMNVIKYNSIEVYFYDEDKKSAEDIVNKIPNLNKNLNSVINVKDLEPLKIIVYKDKQEYNKYTISPNGADTLGLYNNGVINLHNLKTIKEINSENAIDESSEESFFKTVTHEYTHYYIRTYLKENNLSSALPPWLDEGFAQYMEYELYNKDFQLETKPIKGPLIPLRELSTLGQWESQWKDRDSIEKIYTESVLAVNYIFDSKGNEILKNILAQSNDNKISEVDYQSNFDKTIKNNLGLTLDELQNKAIK
ncbi:collagenase [Clostridium sp. YIM B02505]|uniref:Collagenase n=2 Tax=Clostridium yunnanense TaxID=2800325 RepID=A0ABS1EVD1_9CLOT|nr:collagenase [Clostridium yunnanense]